VLTSLGHVQPRDPSVAFSVIFCTWPRLPPLTVLCLTPAVVDLYLYTLNTAVWRSDELKQGATSVTKASRQQETADSRQMTW